MTVEHPPSQINIHQTIAEIGNEHQFAIEIFEMKDSFMIWVGNVSQQSTADPTGIFGSLAVSMPNRYVFL